MVQWLFILSVSLNSQTYQTLGRIQLWQISQLMRDERTHRCHWMLWGTFFFCVCVGVCVCANGDTQLLWQIKQWVFIVFYRCLFTFVNVLFGWFTGLLVVCPGEACRFQCESWAGGLGGKFVVLERWIWNYITFHMATAMAKKSGKHTLQYWYKETWTKTVIPQWLLFQPRPYRHHLHVVIWCAWYVSRCNEHCQELQQQFLDLMQLSQGLPFAWLRDAISHWEDFLHSHRLQEESLQLRSFDTCFKLLSLAAAIGFEWSVTTTMDFKWWGNLLILKLARKRWVENWTEKHKLYRRSDNNRTTLQICDSTCAIYGHKHSHYT